MNKASGQSRTSSRELAARAVEVIPGGVNSPVRAMRSVEGDPLFIARGEGPRVWDVEGRVYVDYIGSWGPLILGHADPAIAAAIREAADSGTSFGANTEAEVAFAELLTEVVPSLQKVRLVNSGTEACMSALRLARGYTGRSRIVKMVGGYHGHADALLVKAGSGAETLGIPDSAGVPPGAAADTLLLPFNDLDSAKELFSARGEGIAAVIVEPVAGNMGTVPPAAGYLEGLRRLTEQHGALLIFDEVMTGFRLALGGAQQLFGVTPDLTCLGKVIGGGLPVGAYGGRAEIMDRIAPDGPVYQAGTLSGNPLAVAAGMATISALRDDPPYAQLERAGSALREGLLEAAEEAGVEACVNQQGSMITLFFCGGPVTDLDGAKSSDLQRFARYHREMRARGVLLPPSQFEAAFISAAHGHEAIDHTLDAARGALKQP